MKRKDKFFYILPVLLLGLLIVACSDMEKDFEADLIKYPSISVEGFSPKTGRPGSPVTISGSNFGEFSDAAVVTFNDVEVATFDSYSDTEMVVLVPEDAGTGPIQVNVWTHSVLLEEEFEYIPGAVVAEVSHNRGQEGDTVIISGEHFSKDASQVSVKIGALTAEVLSVTETEIQFEVPDAESGTLFLTIEGQTLELDYFLIGGEKLTGSLIGHNSSYGDNPDTYITAGVDGDISTFIDGPTATGYVGYDLGFGKEAALTSVRYVPRESHPQRMVGGEIRGSNDPSLTEYDVLYTITEEPSVGIYTEVSLTTDNSYRYIYYYSPDGFGNLAEIEFYGNALDAEIPEGMYSFDFNSPTENAWEPQQGAGYVIEDGQLKVTFPSSQFEGTNKRRADLKFVNLPWIYTTDYPILAIKISSLPAEGNVRADIRGGSFNNNDYVKDFLGQDVIYWDLRDHGLTDMRIELDLMQVKIADITSDETGYEVDWIRTFNSVEELSGILEN